MPFVPFTLAETAAKFLLRQAWYRKMKDNFDDHELRLVRSGLGFSVSEHFHIKAPTGGGGFAEILPPLFEEINSAGSNFSYPAFSVIELVSTGASALVGLVYRRPFNFGAVVPPLRFKARVKRGNDVAFHAGLKNVAGVTDVNGIWLERVDASNWRFVSYNGSRNNGTSFASVATGTWFEFEIVFTNTPSNQALCYLNGVLKETLTSQLPTSSDLWSTIVLLSTAGSQTINFNRWDYSADGSVDAA